MEGLRDEDHRVREACVSCLTLVCTDGGAAFFVTVYSLSVSLLFFHMRADTLHKLCALARMLHTAYMKFACTNLMGCEAWHV